MLSNFYTIVTILIVLTATFSYINLRYFKLPATIGVMLISLICSLSLIFIGKSFPIVMKIMVSAVETFDFETILMKVMLSFLLFAGAIHIDIGQLKKELTPIATYATLGVCLSTAIVGSSMFFVFQWFGWSIPIIHCLVFGALVSPTDPIAVLGILKESKIDPSTEIKIAGESLFNDGVGVVIFASLINIAILGSEEISISQVGLLFLKEAGGGILWGLLLGYVGFLLLRSIDHYQVEVLITIALVMGGYLLASYLHISGPLAMVIAGIIIGNKGRREAMSDTTKDYLNKFWELIDEILNALLFLLIGFEMVVLSFDLNYIGIGLCAIIVVLLARLISVYVPTTLLAIRRSVPSSLVPMLTWGGLRGGISVALALSLPKSEFRDVMVSSTYIIVVFSIVVQGMTIGKLAKRLQKKSMPMTDSTS